MVENDLESTARLFADLAKKTKAVVGIGGAKALDVAKYIGFLARLPFYLPRSCPTVRSMRF